MRAGGAPQLRQSHLAVTLSGIPSPRAPSFCSAPECCRASTLRSLSPQPSLRTCAGYISTCPSHLVLLSVHVRGIYPPPPPSLRGMALRQSKPDGGAVCPTCKGGGKNPCFNCKVRGSLGRVNGEKIGSVGGLADSASSGAWPGEGQAPKVLSSYRGLVHCQPSPRSHVICVALMHDISILFRGRESWFRGNAQLPAISAKEKECTFVPIVRRRG